MTEATRQAHDREALADLAEYVQHFRARVLQDALAEATALYWSRRAEQFEAAIPRHDDYAGQATAVELQQRGRCLAAIAEACRHRASVARFPASVTPMGCCE